MSDSEWVVHTDEAGVRLDKYLAAPGRLGSRAKAFAGLERGKVFVDGGEAGVTDAATPLAAGQTVRVWMDRPGSAKARRTVTHVGDLRIVFEDESLVVVDKPAGLLSVPLERKSDAPSVYEQIENHFRPFGKRRPFVVHRIDQDTSGLVVFAKDARAQSQLKAQFKRREPRRIYLAVVYGHPDPPAGIWRDDLVWDENACGPAAATRSASKRSCGATRWSARSATPTARTCCGRSSSNGTRCTRGNWRSSIRSTGGRSSSRRRRRQTCSHSSNDCGGEMAHGSPQRSAR